MSEISGNTVNNISLVLTTDVLGRSDGLFVQSVVDLSFSRLVPDDAAVGDDDDDVTF
jgi:hypothetical protein